MTVLSNGILAVKVEQGAVGFRIQKDFQEDGDTFQLFYRYNPVHVQDDIYLCDFKRVDLPSGNYKLIGLHSADKPLSEDQCRELVEKVPHDYGYDYFKCYNNEGWGFDTATESLESWMQENKVFTVNPFGDEPNKKSMRYDPAYGGNQLYHEELERWNQAQQRTGSFVFLRAI
jgi:hypothetical protein